MSARHRPVEVGAVYSPGRPYSLGYRSVLALAGLSRPFPAQGRSLPVTTMIANRDTFLIHRTFFQILDPLQLFRKSGGRIVPPRT